MSLLLNRLMVFWILLVAAPLAMAGEVLPPTPKVLPQPIMATAPMRSV